MCECIVKINKQLEENGSNTAVETLTSLSKDKHKLFSTVALKTRKINTKNKTAMAIMASFCPFCGEKYESTQKESIQ